MKFKMILLLIGLLGTHTYASCNKQEVMKLIDKGFSKAEINSICDIQAKSTAKPKPKKSKWITPSNSTCRAKGGHLEEGVCRAKWQQAKNICHASGGRLPTLNELTQVIEACGGVVVNNDSDKGKKWEEKINENMGNPNYQRCYKQKGFPASFYYWSSTIYAGYSDGLWVVGFDYGNQDNYTKRGSSYVRCVRDRQ